MIIKFLFTIVIIYLIYRVAKGIKRIPSNKERKYSLNANVHTIQGGDLVQDPCCLTYIPEGDAYKVSFGGKTLYFCSQACFKKYEMEQRKQS